MTILPDIPDHRKHTGITVRDRRFALEDALASDLASDWAGDAFTTALFNAMSMSFPEGEKQFIASIRAFLPRIKDAQLKAEALDFCAQESIHSREHRKYNKLLCKLRGYDLSYLEAPYLARINQAKTAQGINKRIVLASTVCMEHITAMLSQSVLEGWALSHATPAVREMWRWHGMEELEHKSVAYDVYLHVRGKRPLLHRIMKINAAFFVRDTLTITLRILRHDGKLWTWNTLVGLTTFFLSPKGALWRHYRAYKRFFEDGFHPKHHDTDHLIQAEQERLSSTVKQP